jgi:hypothetical protein
MVRAEPREYLQSIADQGLTFDRNTRCAQVIISHEGAIKKRILLLNAKLERPMYHGRGTCHEMEVIVRCLVAELFGHFSFIPAKDIARPLSGHPVQFLIVDDARGFKERLSLVRNSPLLPLESNVKISPTQEGM